MNNQYEDIKESLEGINCPENYIQKGLYELGFESFPDSGLSDRGTSKLIHTILDIYRNDSDLNLKNYKTKIQKEKIKKPRKKAKSLEAEILREDLEKIGNFMKEKVQKVVKGTVKTITYPTLGVNLAFPIMFQKAYDNDDEWEGCSFGKWYKGWTITGAILGTAALYTTLALTAPPLIIPAILIQAGTNIASGLYEWRRSIKERAYEKEKELEKVEEILYLEK